MMHRITLMRTGVSADCVLSIRRQDGVATEGSSTSLELELDQLSSGPHVSVGKKATDLVGCLERLRWRKAPDMSNAIQNRGA